MSFLYIVFHNFAFFTKDFPKFWRFPRNTKYLKIFKNRFREFWQKPNKLSAHMPIVLLTLLGATVAIINSIELNFSNKSIKRRCNGITSKKRYRNLFKMIMKCKRTNHVQYFKNIRTKAEIPHFPLRYSRIMVLYEKHIHNFIKFRIIGFQMRIYERSKFYVKSKHWIPSQKPSRG